MVYAIQICVTFLFLFDPQYSENGRMSPKRPNGTGAAAKTPAGPTETADQATSGTKKNTRAVCRPLATATLAHIPYVTVSINKYAQYVYLCIQLSRDKYVRVRVLWYRGAHGQQKLTQSSINSPPPGRTSCLPVTTKARPAGTMAFALLLYRIIQ